MVSFMYIIWLHATNFCFVLSLSYLHRNLMLRKKHATNFPSCYINMTQAAGTTFYLYFSSPIYDCIRYDMIITISQSLIHCSWNIMSQILFLQYWQRKGYTSFISYYCFKIAGEKWLNLILIIEKGLSHECLIKIKIRY